MFVRTPYTGPPPAVSVVQLAASEAFAPAVSKPGLRTCAEASVAHTLTANMAAKCLLTTVLPSFVFFGVKNNDEAEIITYFANDCKLFFPNRVFY